MRVERHLSLVPGVSVKRVAVLWCFVLAGACAGSGVLEEASSNARPMEGGNGVAYGDCAGANRMAAAKPDLDVDSLPRPVSQKPAPFSKMPPEVWSEIRTKGSSVKVDVVVDTLGRPVMRTFTVVETSHPWLAQNLRSAMPSWRFRAARLAGCKVSRVYKFSASSKPRA
jgi:hypothetical protein